MNRPMGEAMLIPHVWEFVALVLHRRTVIDGRRKNCSASLNREVCDEN